MLSRCKVLLCCMCFTAALTVASGQIRGAELALFCPLGSTAAAMGATCIPADHGCHFHPKCIKDCGSATGYAWSRAQT